jgi:hypothetical protein
MTIRMRRVTIILCLAFLLAALVLSGTPGAVPAILAPLWLFVAAIVPLTLLPSEAFDPLPLFAFFRVFSSRPPPAL